MMEVCLLILMGSVNIFAQKQDIVGMEKLTKLVSTVVVVELQVIFRCESRPKFFLNIFGSKNNMS